MSCFERKEGEKKSKLSMLMVDDDQFNLLSAELCIKRHFQDITIHQAKDGREALTKLQTIASSIDFVLMDGNMPIMDGFEATKRITEDQQKGLLPPFPVIGLTAFTSDEFKIKCKEAGMVKRLTKPLRVN